MTSSATNSRSGNLVSQAGNWVKEKGWKIATVMAAGSLALAGCAEAKPTPTETSVEVVKTIDQYVSELTQYTDPSELQLPAGADAETFGRWVVDLEDKWKFASCDRTTDIATAASDLSLGDWAQELYPKIAESNAPALTVAMFGTNHASKPSAISWGASMTEVNARGIDFCMLDAKDQAITEEFVSASEVGKDGEGNPIFEVVRNIIPGANSGEQTRQSTTVYDTSVEGGNLVVDSFSINGTEIK